jgi:hypothetical protein
MFLTALAAAACVALPAQPGTNVRVHRDGLRVCSGGHAVLLRGAAISDAAAAGRQVAWIERHGRGAVIRVVSVSASGSVRPLRRIVSARGGILRITLTASGDLAWTAGDRVVLARRGRRPRVVAHAEVQDLALEAGRTLRWTLPRGTFGWYDLARVACTRRAGYRIALSTARIAILRRHYGSAGEGVRVLRGCDLRLGRGHVLSQAPDAFPDTDTVEPVAIAGTWAVLVHHRTVRPEPCEQLDVRAIDVARGLGLPWTRLSSLACSPPPLAPPVRGGAVAVTAAGSVAWIAGDALLAATAGKASELDRGGTLAGLRAEGDAVVWTHDGAPRSAVPR